MLGTQTAYFHMSQIRYVSGACVASRYVTPAEISKIILRSKYIHFFCDDSSREELTFQSVARAAQETSCLGLPFLTNL